MVELPFRQGALSDTYRVYSLRHCEDVLVLKKSAYEYEITYFL